MALRGTVLLWRVLAGLYRQATPSNQSSARHSATAPDNTTPKLRPSPDGYDNPRGRLCRRGPAGRASCYQPSSVPATGVCVRPLCRRRLACVAGAGWRLPESFASRQVTSVWKTAGQLAVSRRNAMGGPGRKETCSGSRYGYAPLAARGDGSTENAVRQTDCCRLTHQRFRGGLASVRL